MQPKVEWVKMNSGNSDQESVAKKRVTKFSPNLKGENKKS